MALSTIARRSEERQLFADWVENQLSISSHNRIDRGLHPEQCDQLGSPTSGYERPQG
jgi:hypothetical protein